MKGQIGFKLYLRFIEFLTFAKSKQLIDYSYVGFNPHFGVTNASVCNIVNDIKRLI